MSFSGVFATEIQTNIRNNINSIRNDSIPTWVIDTYNSTYSNPLPANITTVGEAYDAGYLSDGNDGPLSQYANNLVSSGNSGSSRCNYDWTGDVGDALAGCVQGSDVVTSGWDFSVEGNFKAKINSWTRTIASVLWLLAVGSIVLGSFMMVISGGEEEKIKKGKDIIKWSIIGFLWVISAWALISILVNFIFAIG